MKLIFAILAAALLISCALASQHPPLAADSSATSDASIKTSAGPAGADAQRSHLESSVFRRERPVQYTVSDHRDPFRPLIVDEKKTGEIITDLLVLENATLTGVVWANGQYLAIVRDKDGQNFFLHEGDPVYQGRVTLVSQTQASFAVNDFGDYRNIVLKVRAKDKDKPKDNE